jgi:hypothetical protein
MHIANPNRRLAKNADITEVVLLRGLFKMWI